jgi:hypothetical protein
VCTKQLLIYDIIWDSLCIFCWPYGYTLKLVHLPDRIFSLAPVILHIVVCYHLYKPNTASIIVNILAPRADFTCWGPGLGGKRASHSLRTLGLDGWGGK